MQSPEQPVLRDIVLVGGGHSYVVVLKSFGMKPLPGVRLTVICRDTHTPYSGMLPGYIAGHYSYDDVHIDLSTLAAFAGARFFRDEVIALDRAASKVICRNRPPVPYDRLSINIGSAPQMSQVEGAAEHAVAVKPIHLFNQRWLALLERVQRHAGKTRVAIVGAGAGGVELTLAMQYRLRRELQALGRDPNELSFHLFSSDANILPTHNRRVRRSFERVLNERQVVLHAPSEVTRVGADSLQTADGEVLAMDEIVWVTQAGGAPWLRQTGLALDEAGFIQVNEQLQSLSDPHVFAAGDIAAMVGHPLEKAGVFAVRQGKPLAANLRLSVQDAPLLSYRPQRHWLALISTGNRHAVASRGPLSWQGDWVWRWKDWIDRRFMNKFQSFPAMNEAPQGEPSGVKLELEEVAQAISAIAMGGQAQSATAIATVPAGLEAKVEDDVFQMMSGAVEVLNEAGCALVGGHTGEGRELALGFAINGLVDEDLHSVLRKGGMRPGDVLILTKAIGTGTLFAAHARLQTRGRWIDAALESMIQSSRLGAQCLMAHGATACTDLTGFGLLGHLVEMTRPSGVDIELDLAALPLLDGALETSAAGILSSLQPANVRLRRALRNQAEAVSHPNYPLIFDPQTAGGLLATVPAERADACIAELRSLGYVKTVAIGHVLAQGDAIEPIVLKC